LLPLLLPLLLLLLLLLLPLMLHRTPAAAAAASAAAAIHPIHALISLPLPSRDTCLHTRMLCLAAENWATSLCCVV